MRYNSNNTLGLSAFGGFDRPRKHIAPLAIAGIGAGASALTSVLGGIFSGAAARKAARRQREAEAKEEAWYNRRYNEDYADTAAGQNLLRMAKDKAREAWQRESGAAAVAGGTDAAAAMAKEQSAKMVGDTLANIAATDQQAKARVDELHRSAQQGFEQANIQREQQRAQNVANAAQGASNAIMSASVSLLGGSSTGDTDPKTGSSGGEKPNLEGKKNG